MEYTKEQWNEKIRAKVEEIGSTYCKDDIYLEKNGFNINASIQDGIRWFIEWYNEQLVEGIEEMKLEIPEYRNKRGHHTNSAHRIIRHNKALSAVQSLLQDNKE